MNQPAGRRDYQQQSRSTELFIYLSENIVQVGILLVIVACGAIAYVVLDMSEKVKPRAVEKPKWTNNNWLDMRYGDADCAKNAQCRQLKRIYAEGGASQEAVRKNLLEADRSVTFEQLQENAPQYEGIPWAFEGKIHDIIGEEKRGIGDYILAEIRLGDDPGKLLAVRGDFRTDFRENDPVYVVGYLTGTSRPRLGASALKYSGKVVGFSARAFLRPSEAREILSGAR
ncbi:MAG TPA: hypothetical protein VF131_23945 [Blastocatellia bacterium]|nr:hypothetical protein [Blastocatellia bacterium]